jgi:hypothetical protein
MNFRTLTAAALVASAPIAVSAAVIDFTGDSGVTFSASGPAQAVGTFSGGQTLTVTPFPVDSELNRTEYDGVGNFNPDGLALKYDGIGVGVQDDEVTNPSEFLELVFSEVTTITGIWVLDLFKFGANTEQTGDDFTESLLVWFGGREGALDAPDAVLMATSDAFEKGGWGLLSLDFTGTRLTLGAGSGNEVGDPDFALAAVQVVPLPAAGFLLLGGLGGLAALKRRKTA